MACALPRTLAALRTASRTFKTTTFVRRDFLHVRVAWSVINYRRGVRDLGNASSYKASEMTPLEYHSVSDNTMDSLLQNLETLVDSLDDPSCEVEYSSGVLTLNLGKKGTYVINKQPPNMQIWLSSPSSGPKRYDYSSEHDVWFYSRNGETLDGLLQSELSTALDRNVQLKLKS